MSRKSTLEKLIAETGDHIASLEEQPEAYFFRTYANGAFTVTSAAVADDQRAMDIVDLLTNALHDDPCVELEEENERYDTGMKRLPNETLH
jgi:hypothetical protein